MKGCSCASSELQVKLSPSNRSTISEGSGSEMSSTVPIGGNHFLILTTKPRLCLTYGKNLHGNTQDTCLCVNTAPPPGQFYIYRTENLDPTASG
ncbi:hypothetical protein ILYODFUR_032209 [Ilyodon furcidens]|uniref:Uncharacterized protein n=1 Tax=Ilyodon furcidens TaxID=33524 RepID=A0ABV0SQX8_9TELE